MNDPAPTARRVLRHRWSLTPMKHLRAATLPMTVLAGCVVGPNYQPPTVQTPSSWSSAQLPHAATQPAIAATRPVIAASRPAVVAAPPVNVARWWKSLNDRTLDRLIERAVESNLDLRLATARVREARAQRGIASAGFWPQVGLNGSYAYRGSSVNAGTKPKISDGGPLNKLRLPSLSVRNGANGLPAITVIPQSTSFGGGKFPTATYSPGVSTAGGAPGTGTLSLTPPPAGTFTRTTVPRESNLFAAGFDATWELDVFGGIQRGVEAAADDLAAFEETRRDVQVTLVSEVGLNYVQLRGSQRRLAIARENIVSQAKTLDLTRARYNAGFTNELDVAQAQAQLAATRSQVPLLETSIRQAIYQLSVLLGQPPAALLDELEKAAPIPAVPPEIPLGMPSDLLRRRPDIRAAERQLAAATARIGEAVADLFPKFSLTGSAGPAVSDMRHFLDRRSMGWSIGPGVSWPIFQGGRLRAAVEVQNARQEQALATYERTVLTAFQDVEGSLVAYINEGDRRKVLAEAVASNTRAAGLSNQLYVRGLTAFLNVLDSQRALYASQDALVLSETDAVVNLIALYKALGGGWEEPQEISGPPPEPARSAIP